MQSLAGKQQIQEQRQAWKQQERERRKQNMMKVLEEYCAPLTDEEVLDFLRGKQKQILVQRWRELWGFDYSREMTTILNEVIELCMEKYDLWYSVFSNKQSTSPTELSYRPPASPPISDPEA
ncbi:uncharacterized protein [Blastocystis hominis]|uniref:Uncharacterized protein n=1 Tax=Blastocystis hominis TaxID=12968 RepID=D8LVH5_BLAHO|nr:uncharacterized protein [Blastocystis hominis]CBK19814.2 unnamed protein product [Blastocystis hominis]|eukprot:XP_012893862.1 uncharacterized protein [Blastocystis hominis]